MPKFKSFVLSNKLPVSVSRKNGKLVFSESSGGLARAMSSIEDLSRLWIGHPGIASDDLTPKEITQIEDKLLEYKCVPVFLTQLQIERYYEGYSNDTLWPLFHYFQFLVKNNENYWQAYKEVNGLFADTVKKFSDNEPKIWVHDYQLMLCPGMLRKIMPDATIGFFLHIPFPSYEIFRQLPDRQEIMQGLLGADLIGFHIYDYSRHFLSSAERIEGTENNHSLIQYHGRKIQTDTFPIGIDYEKYTDALSSEAVQTESAAIAEHYKDMKIILSVDRLDYSKGILQRLEAYELFLSEHPEYHEKLVLVMVAVPSRTEVETYKELRDNIELTISRINGRYAGVNWTPISYQFKNLPFEKVVALYNSAAVALVTPLRDGMNLVAKEYVATKQNTPGVLVLSEMAGAIDELPEAISINPNSIRSITDALEQALAMPVKEQKKRLRVMQKRLKDYDVKDWAADFMEQLNVAAETEDKSDSKLLTTDLQKMLVKAYKRASSRLLLLDYDGVLREFVKSSKAEDAEPSQKIYKIIERLSKDKDVKTCVVSGRTKEDLEHWFGKLNITLVAEHGAWVKDNDEWRESYSSFSEHKEVLLETMKKYAKRTAGASVEEKTHSLVWHYRRVKPELAYARNTNLTGDLERSLMDTDIGIFQGNKIIEVKPVSINKGIVAKQYYEEMKADFTICIGDDYTDEDMFNALPDEAFTIKVGMQDTAAMFALKDVAAVHSLLEDLTS
jgi:trehalose 6-phosphate synthase/phosphatase